jgi:type II secretory ATPase GspE/PulE/Tfp pilus assembly ATPase PilB-like protein
MVPSPSNPSQPDNQDLSPPSAQSQGSDLSDRETEQMFRLIDSILPFEACLYYQFVPLCLEGRHLKLGMVTPQDPSALGYVRHILAYLNCSLKTEAIDAEEHQSLLSAYLSHTHKSSSAQKQAAQNHSQRPSQPEQPPVILDESPAATDESYRHTDLVPLTTTTSVALTQAAQLSSEIPSLERQEEEIAASDADVASVSEVSSASDTVPLLQVNALYVSRPIEFLGTLAPPQLLQELLGRVLLGGIGRLYFERQPNQGRILWSQDGVLQSVLEGLSLRTFQGVILELKRLVNLPLIPITQPKQVEIERRYQQEELLLRLRVMPGTHGEEATLQVLRGAALKFYQRQQLEKLGQDALKLAQQLQRKLSEIRARAYRNPVPLEALPALNQMMEGLDKQMEALLELQTHQDSDKPAR